MPFIVMAVGMIIPIIQIIPLIVLMSGSGSSGGPAEMDDAAGDGSSNGSQSGGPGPERPLTAFGIIEAVAQAVQAERSVQIEFGMDIETLWIRNNMRTANEDLMRVVVPPQHAPPPAGPIEVTWVRNIQTGTYFTVRVLHFAGGRTLVDVQVFDQQAAGQQVIALS
jgi:hypothetical protein